MSKVIAIGKNGSLSSVRDSDTQEAIDAYCKERNILCGELTILIKMFDLINGVTDIMMKTSHNYETLMFNLNIIDFKKLYNLYLKSLDNTELLINIKAKDVI